MNTCLIDRDRGFHAHTVLRLLLGVVCGLVASNSCWPAGNWIETGSMNAGRWLHTATLLPDGRVLAAGGEQGWTESICSAELYDPATGTWSYTGSMKVARHGHTATLLPNGTVLVAGGSDRGAGFASAEIYDPAVGTWSYSQSMSKARANHTATLLADGRVLVAGNADVSAELYDPATGTWSDTGNLNIGRDAHAATLLPEGKVLVVGGYLPFVPYTSVELYDPVTGSWSITGNLNEGRGWPTATLLPDGKVLVAGSDIFGTILASAELYDSATGRWTNTGSMTEARGTHTATLLPDGSVLVAGGAASCCDVLGTETYSWLTGTWASAGSMNSARSFPTATLLADYRVLLAGGTSSGMDTWLASAELYIPQVRPPGMLIIHIPPGNQSAPVGTAAFFSVIAIGSSPLSYQWQFNGADLKDGGQISGSTTSSLTINAVSPEDAGAYTVLVSDAHGSVASKPATLTVLLRPPEITIEPVNQTVVSGASASFTVAATGSLPMTCQWRRNGIDLPDGGRITGARATTLNIAAAGVEDLGVYTVSIQNAYGSTTSAPATLTVTLEPPDITADPLDQSVFSGADASFGVTAVGSLPLSYQWQRNGIELTDGGRISGSQTATLRIAATEAEDLGLYLVEVRNAYGWTVSLPARLTVVLAPPMITVEPQGQTVALGTTIALQVQATGSLPLTYQWQRAGVDAMDEAHITGAKTRTLNISELSVGDLGNYGVVVENRLGRTQSKVATIATFSAVLQIQHDGAQVVVGWNEAGNGMMLETASGLGNPDWQDVPGSDLTNTVSLPMTEATAFFRLVHGLEPPWGVVAWWPGDGNADDIVGSNHGTLVNGVTFAPGTVGMAFSFDDRTSAHVTMPSSPSLNVGTGDFSMECWISTSSTKDVNTIQDKRLFEMGQWVNGYCFYLRPGGIGPGLQLMYMGLEGYQADMFLADGRFHHVAATVRRNAPDGIRLFVDGNVVKTGDPTPFSTSSLDNATDFLIGGHSLDDWRTFSGLIDEFRFYKRALNDDEIRAIYETGIAGVNRVSH